MSVSSSYGDKLALAGLISLMMYFSASMVRQSALISKAVLYTCSQKIKTTVLLHLAQHLWLLIEARIVVTGFYNTQLCRFRHVNSKDTNTKNNVKYLNTNCCELLEKFITTAVFNLCWINKISLIQVKLHFGNSDWNLSKLLICRCITLQQYSYYVVVLPIFTGGC